MLNNLYTQSPQILDKICKIKNYMRENNLTVLELRVNYLNENRTIYIRLNTFPSPDGALGMFLLLPRNWVSYRPIPNDILNYLIFKGNLEEIENIFHDNENIFNLMYSQRDRLQEKFEFYTYVRLKNNNIPINCVKNCETPQYNECINEFDFIFNCHYGIEIKSDKWIQTGNLSLELLRNYNVENCIQNTTNIGSILKTKADFWQEYFYNEYTGDFLTEIYSVQTLQTFTKYYIDVFYTHFILNQNN